MNVRHSGNIWYIKNIRSLVWFHLHAKYVTVPILHSRDYECQKVLGTKISFRNLKSFDPLKPRPLLSVSAKLRVASQLKSLRMLQLLSMYMAEKTKANAMEKFSG